MMAQSCGLIHDNVLYGIKIIRSRNSNSVPVKTAQTDHSRVAVVVEFVLAIHRFPPRGVERVKNCLSLSNRRAGNRLELRMTVVLFLDDDCAVENDDDDVGRHYL